MGLKKVLTKFENKENNSKAEDKAFVYCPASLEDVVLRDYHTDNYDGFDNFDE